MKAEAWRGHRRYAGTAQGENYKRIRLWSTDDGEPPRPTDRTLGDIVAPERPARATDAVNRASVRLGTDAAEWTVVRLLSLLGQIEREARQRAES